MNALLFVAISVLYIICTHTQAYPETVSVQISCHELSVTGTWNKTEFLGGEVTKLEWNDPNCAGFQTSGEEFSASTNFSTCQSVIMQNNDTITQKNTARVHITYVTQNIQRDIIYNFELRCVMQRHIHTPNATSYEVTEKRFFGETNKTQQAEFDVRMDIYRDSTFAQVFANPMVTSYSPIFVGIREAHNNTMLKFVVKTCYATPTADRNDATSFTFFYKKCPSEESYERFNAPESHFYFKIDSFVFVRVSRSIYIHCDLVVCETNANSEACTQEANCEKRKRREVSLGKDEPLREIMLMTQQVTILPPTCNDIRCPAYSLCIDLSPPVCRCGTGYVLVPDTNTCINERTFVIYGLKFEAVFQREYNDPYSTAFNVLAIRIEKQLMFLLTRLQGNTIMGVKVTSMREGSVVVDVRVTYTVLWNEKEAYESFIKATSKDHTDTVTYPDALPIIPRSITSITPTMPTKKDNSSPSVTLILSIVIPLIVAVFIVVFVVKERKRLCPRTEEAKEVDIVRTDSCATIKENIDA